MNCKICYSPYDHSIHMPFSLSCPHTICISCVNQLTQNKCPTCNAVISIKNPNIGLLKLIPETSYDQLKAAIEKFFNEINQVKNSTLNKANSKLNNYLVQINRTRDNIENETNKFIHLVVSNKTKLLTELTQIEQYVKEELQIAQLDSKVKKLAENKSIIRNNSIRHKELANLVEKSNRIKKKFNNKQSKIEAFKENIEFTANKSVSLEDGLIGEIQTNKKVN